MCLISATNHELLYVIVHFSFESDSWVNGACNCDLYDRYHIGIVHDVLTSITQINNCAGNQPMNHIVENDDLLLNYDTFMVSRAAGWSVITSYNNTTSRSVTYVHFLSTMNHSVPNAYWRQNYDSKLDLSTE